MSHGSSVWGGGRGGRSLQILRHIYFCICIYEKNWWGPVVRIIKCKTRTHLDIIYIICVFNPPVYPLFWYLYHFPYHPPSYSLNSMICMNSFIPVTNGCKQFAQWKWPYGQWRCLRLLSGHCKETFRLWYSIVIIIGNTRYIPNRPVSFHFMPLYTGIFQAMPAKPRSELSPRAQYLRKTKPLSPRPNVCVPLSWAIRSSNLRTFEPSNWPVILYVMW